MTIEGPFFQYNTRARQVEMAPDYERSMLTERRDRELEDYLAQATWKEWPSDTARVQQSANITTSGVISSYQFIGGLVHAHFYAVLTSAGTSGTAISIKLPVPAKADSAGHGTITYLDNGTQYLHGGAVIFNSGTRIQCFPTGSGAAMGSIPAFAVANNDAIWCDMIYRPA